MDEAELDLGERYADLGSIGVGGMAVVHRVHDRELDRVLAMKIVRAADLSDAWIDRFLAEARVLAEIRHPHVLRVYRSGTEAGWHWFVMDLADRSRKREQPPLLYDLTLRGGTLDTGLVGRRLCAITSRLAASPGYLDAHGRPTHPRELVGHRLLRYTATPSVRPWTFTRDGEVAEIDVDAAYSADSGEALVAAAVAGLGVANEPDFLVDAHLASGALELLLPDWKGFSAHFWALTPSRFPSAATRAILDALDENLRSNR
ncbi:MAG: hypothetical protein KC656_22720 [Myxococcales bacterium]|nr:hypothetical protein [Myxococcales bacterium]